ncbi:MAG: hypothetical protein HFJ61_08540 [Akkermansia muciniphila]|nr:hypothetical protein [Akkermansia muciniphila]
MSSRSQTERKKRPLPRPSYPGLPQEAPDPAVIPGPTRRTENSRNGPSRYDTPPQRRASRPSPKEEYEDNPEREEEKRSARAGTMRRPRFTIFGALLFVLLMPFRFIGSLTRNIRWFICWPLRILLGCCFVGIVIGAILVFLYGTISNRYDISEVKSNIPERTVILDRKNRTIGTLHGENRKRVSLQEVPPVFIDALLLREDNRFYDHGGVDWIGVGRAFAQVLKHKRATQGASTLTMQLAKITYNHRERNLHSKLTEVALAKRIEATYTKDEILETYINRIFWGHTFLGIAAAARGYYDKEPRDLSLAECATLAGIIYGPNDFSPIKHPEEAKKVRDIVLGLLKNEGKITEVQYQAALAEPIATRTPQSRSEENYAMGLVRRELDAILEEEDIRLGGLVVHTTLDLDLQNATLDAINKHMDALEARKDFKKHLASLQAKREKRGILKNKLTTKAEYEASLAAWKALPAEQKEKTQPPMPNYIQSAAVVMDNATGALLAVVGGRDAEESKLNRAIQSRRQTGSLFKPFIYATFFQQGNSADTRISDDRIAYGEIRGAANCLWTLPAPTAFLPTGAYAPRRTSLTILRIPRASRASPSPRASAPSIPSGRRTLPLPSSSRSASPEARQAKLPRWALNPPAAAKPEPRIIIRTHGSPDIRPTSPAVSGWGLIPPPKFWKKATEAPWPCPSGWTLCLPPRRKAIPPTPSVRVPVRKGRPYSSAGNPINWPIPAASTPRLRILKPPQATRPPPTCVNGTFPWRNRIRKRAFPMRNRWTAATITSPWPNPWKKRTASPTPPPSDCLFFPYDFPIFSLVPGLFAADRLRGAAGSAAAVPGPLRPPRSGIPLLAGTGGGQNPDAPPGGRGAERFLRRHQRGSSPELGETVSEPGGNAAAKPAPAGQP